jgi:hypothetical protein
MKSLLRISLSLTLALAVMAAVGCSKKENPTTPVTTTPPAQSVTYAQGVTSNGLDAIDFASGFSGGLSGWDPGTSQPKSLQGKYPIPANAAKWDTMWHGPTTHANYWNDTATGGWFYVTLMDTINLTMTVWAKATPDTNNPTRVDWEFNLAMGDTGTEYSAYCEEVNDTTFNGGWYIGYKIGTTTVYYWRFTWTNVTSTGWTGTTRTCSGQFNYTSNYGVSGSFTFTNGSGTGSASLNGTVFVNYVFNNNGTGYYTIVGYSTQYPFNW